MNVTRALRVITALVFVAVLIAAFVPVLNDVFNRHVLSVRVTGKFDHLARPELEAVVREQLSSASFFTVEVESLRRAAASLPWVRDVAVRRVWPDSVHIAVQERVAVVRWNDDALMEDDASIFKPRDGIDGFELAQLAGPAGQHAQVLDQFRQLSAGIGMVGGGVAGVSLSERGQWEVRFANGMTVVPSTPFDVAALMEFSRILPAILGSDIQRVARIDLRYANGFAVRWREAGEETNVSVKDDGESISQGRKG